MSDLSCLDNEQSILVHTLTVTLIWIPFYIITCLFNRCFLSAGSPASSPAKSRVVEALCILLCQRHSISKREVKAGKVVCTTRWRLVISDYNSIRARFLNTTALDRVNLVLFTINETTRVKWYKNDVRRDEIRMLMQGLPPSQPQLCADDDLLPAKELPSSPAPPPVKLHSFPEAEDTSGQATVRRKPSPPPVLQLVLVHRLQFIHLLWE